MKVLQITTHFNVGGITNYILTLSRALAGKDIQTVVFSSGGDMEAELSKSGIPHRKVGIKTKFELAPKVIAAGFKAAAIIKNENIDIIHAHTRVSQVAAAIASRFTGVPYVTTCHGYFKKRLRGILDTWGMKVIAISGAVRKHLEADLGVDAGRIALIYSGVDAAKFSHGYSQDEIISAKRSLGLKGGPVIGAIGRLSPVKGHEFLLRAMKDIIAAKPGAQCLIIGDGEERSRLESLAGSSGIDSSVKFVESCPDTHKYLSLMDVFIFPSIKEGLGIALLEALAAGRACVASRIGGIENIIEDGRNGLLVGVADPAAIAAAVKTLLGDEGLRKRMGAEGRALVAAKFTLDSMAVKIAELYRETVKR
ncbi:MAG: glycosyltransferase family 4 protein [Candidatus Omnitrophica bacterium]|nr:glycosyltransferase family 4 protein [Candidatus Omnitrophota bacterium]